MENSSDTKNKLRINSSQIENRIVLCKSYKKEIKTGFDTEEITKEPLDTFLDRHQVGLEQLLKRSNFVFDGVERLRCKCHNLSLSYGGSYLDSPMIKKQTCHNKYKKMTDVSSNL